MECKIVQDSGAEILINGLIGIQNPRHDAPSSSARPHVHHTTSLCDHVGAISDGGPGRADPPPPPVGPALLRCGARLCRQLICGRPRRAMVRAAVAGTRSAKALNRYQRSSSREDHGSGTKQ
jgi:hypothetical protein